MTGALAVTTFCDPDAKERLLEGGPGSRQVDTLVVARFERSLGLASCLLCLLEVDLAGHVGRLGQDDDLVRSDLQEPADDGERLLDTILAEPQLPDTERRDERRMMRQDAELSLGAGHLDRVDGVRVDAPLGGDDLEVR